MSEQTSGKKVVDRNIAIALGIICILLAVGLVGMFVYYAPMINNITSDKDAQIASLQSQLADLQNQISSKDSQIHSLNVQISTFNLQKQILEDIINLANSEIWVDKTVIQRPPYYTSWTFTADYAGYIEVKFQTSNTPDTYVRVTYSSHGVNYDNKIDLTTGGNAVFPILPSTSIEIRVGNTNLYVASSVTLTITYYY